MNALSKKSITQNNPGILIDCKWEKFIDWSIQYYPPRRQTATFLLQIAFNSDFHDLGLAQFFYHFPKTHKIRFSFRLTVLNFQNLIRRDVIG